MPKLLRDDDVGHDGHGTDRRDAQQPDAARDRRAKAEHQPHLPSLITQAK